MPRSKFCPQCGTLRVGPLKQTIMHYRICVPRRQWPDDVRAYVDHPAVVIPTSAAPAVLASPVAIERAQRLAEAHARDHARDRERDAAIRESTLMRQAAEAAASGRHLEVYACVACGFVAVSASGLVRHKQQSAKHKTPVLVEEVV